MKEIDQWPTLQFTLGEQSVLVGLFVAEHKLHSVVQPTVCATEQASSQCAHRCLLNLDSRLSSFK